MLFGAALNRVAFVNNIPLRARGLFHPSIANRLLYLEEMSQDPARTGRFDQVMRRMYLFFFLARLSPPLFLMCGSGYPGKKPGREAAAGGRAGLFSFFLDK